MDEWRKRRINSSEFFIEQPPPSDMEVLETKCPCGCGRTTGYSLKKKAVKYLRRR